MTARPTSREKTLIVYRNHLYQSESGKPRRDYKLVVIEVSDQPAREKGTESLIGLQ
jgi:hypothetical protein